MKTLEKRTLELEIKSIKLRQAQLKMNKNQRFGLIVEELTKFGIEHAIQQNQSGAVIRVNDLEIRTTDTDCIIECNGVVFEQALTVASMMSGLVNILNADKSTNKNRMLESYWKDRPWLKRNLKQD